MQNARFSALVVLLVVTFMVSLARASFFVMPTDGTLYVSAAGGDAAATSEFGTGTTVGDFHPLITGLPTSPIPAGEVEVGKFFSGTSIDFGMKTIFSGTFYAFSIDTVTAGSRTTFMDLNNSLGFGGTVVQQTATNQYLLHLDDAASAALDDDDNDVLIGLRVVPGVVPEPTMAMGVSLLALLLMRARRVHG